MQCFNIKGCFQWFKDTNLKANHNADFEEYTDAVVVSNGSKILIWKQITTDFQNMLLDEGCFQWFKDTNLKANHNTIRDKSTAAKVVSNGSKILIWKQITTLLGYSRFWEGCFQWFKDTNLKANHNGAFLIACNESVVSNGSKILIWKQITTGYRWTTWFARCFQWFKDTNLKANHNCYG